MSHRRRDIFLWGVLCSAVLLAVFWLGSGTREVIPTHLPPAGDYRAMGDLFCFIAAMDAIFIVLVHVIVGPSSTLTGDLRERKRLHASRVVFMASVACAFSLLGTELWFVPLTGARRWLADAPSIAGSVFVLMAIASGLGIVFARRQQLRVAHAAPLLR